MRRMLRLAGAVVVAMLALSQSSAAQSKFLYIGGGATMPMGDYKEYAKTGFMADVGLGTNIGSSGKMFGFVDVIYGKNSHDTTDESTTLMGGGANIGMQSSGASTRIYGYVGAGMQNHKYNPAGGGDGGSETKPYGRGALGLSFGSGKTTFWVEAGVIQGFGGDDGNTAYMPIIAGVSIGW